MSAFDFEGWLDRLLDQSKADVQTILNSKMALHFLIAWSLFESKCFGGSMRMDHLDAFADRLANREAFDLGLVSDAATHFHARYQDKRLYKHLMHQQSSKRMVWLLRSPFAALKPQDTVFLVAVTVYRYRNNMFHGNKHVLTWLQFVEQIELCTRAMQSFVSHAESIAPTMKLSRVA